MRYIAIAFITTMLVLILVTHLLLRPPPSAEKPRPPAPVRETVSIRVHRLIPSARLITCTADQTVSIKKSSDNWRGKATVSVQQPVRMAFCVDLQKIRSNYVQWSPKRQILTVMLPPLEVAAIDYDLEKAEVHQSVGWGRTVARVGAYLELLAKRDIHRAARKLADSELVRQRAQLQSLPIVKKTLERIIQAIHPEGRVELVFRK